MNTLSIVIPCYNEERTLAQLLDRVLAAETPGWQKEIIVVNDCSTDSTAEILARYSSIKVISQPVNGGKGTAVRRGLEEATGSHVLIQDADLEYDPQDFAALLSKIDDGSADVVYGSRNLNPRTRQGSKIARLGVWMITKEINILHGLSLTDVWTCYKLFPREASGDFVQGHFESELLFTAALARRNYRFAEVPISYNPREISEGKKIRYRDGFYAILVLAIDWLKHLF